MTVAQPSLPVPEHARGEGRSRALPRFVVWGVVVVGGFMLLAAMLLPNMCRAREPANRAKCASNLHQIGLAILLYQADHGGAYPDTLGRLAANEQINASAFVCPSGNEMASDAATPAALIADIDAGPAGHHCSYLYFRRGLTDKTATAETIVACDALDEHSDDGVDVLYGDGHAEWGTPAAVVRLLPPELIPDDPRWRRAAANAAAATRAAGGHGE